MGLGWVDDDDDDDAAVAASWLTLGCILASCA
jgi:hypothetical protein